MGQLPSESELDGGLEQSRRLVEPALKCVFAAFMTRKYCAQ
jgi:hypothetical protein